MFHMNYVSLRTVHVLETVTRYFETLPLKLRAFRYFLQISRF
jgi:hypothetical protein